jgi:drug/metabolite transporter (DMT)-like permease
LSTRQWVVLALLTIVWGVNWPIMKIGVTDFAPLSFRCLSLWLGLPILASALRAQRLPFRIERADWRELGVLAVTNMVIWHVLAILAVHELSSGRAAILGYTMPVFAALWGTCVFGERWTPRAMAGIAAAASGVVLLLWHELTSLAGRPVGVGLMLGAAAGWGFGTHQLRRTRIAAPTLTISFWMSVITAFVMTACALAMERTAWHAPAPPVWAAIAFNAVLIFGFAQPAWFYLARGLPPLASTLSIMLIPVIGLASGAWWLGETLYWHDLGAIVALLGAIASVLWPARSSGTPPPQRA